MSLNDTWLRALERQEAIVESARLDLADSIKADWRVLEAEMRFRSVNDAYARLLSDAPKVVVRSHVRRSLDSKLNP